MVNIPAFLRVYDNGTLIYSGKKINFIGATVTENAGSVDVEFAAVVTETDPVFSASAASGITGTNISNWNAAFGWGNHASANYKTNSMATARLLGRTTAGVGAIEEIQVGSGLSLSGGTLSATGGSETDPVFSASAAAGITGTNISNWNAAFGWGNHASAGYLTSYSETDPVFSASAAAGIAGGDITNWNNAFGWGNHASAGYLTSESDPVFSASAAAGIAGGDITNWNAAFGWGDHASAGYALLNGSNQPFTGNLNISKASPKITLTSSATDSPTVYLEKLSTFDGAQLVSQNRRYQPASAISIGGTSGSMSSAPSLTTYSISFWYWSDNINYQSVFCNGTHNINFRGQAVSPPYIRVSGFGGSTIDFVAASGQPMLAGRWTHIVYMRNASTGQAYMYYDGVASPQNGSTVGTTTLSSFTVPTTTNGDIDEFICYDKILSEGEIAALYNSGSPVRITDYTNVVLHWSADQASGTTLTDNSGNGRHVTGITGATWVTGRVSSNVLQALTDIPLAKIVNNGVNNSYGDLTYGYYSGSYGTSNYYDGLTHSHRVLGTTRLQVTSSGITVTGAATLTNITASTLTISGALTMSGVINGCTQIAVTNGFYANAGLVGTPSMSWSADSNSGLYSYGSDQIGVSTGGTLRMYIGNSGQVGLATASPSANARLDIADGGMSLVMGANSSSTTRTNVTDKISRTGGYHYTNAEEPVALLFHSSTTSANTVGIGGGSSLMNAATVINFYSAANTTTTTGNLISFIDNNGFNMSDAKDIIFNATTGTKIGSANTQKLSLWGATPNVQPTNAITAAAFVANTSGIVDDTATWGGYTGGQIVAALQRIGALA